MQHQAEAGNRRGKAGGWQGRRGVGARASAPRHTQALARGRPWVITRGATALFTALGTEKAPGLSRGRSRGGSCAWGPSRGGRRAHFQQCSKEPCGCTFSLCGQSSLVKARRKLWWHSGYSTGLTAELAQSNQKDASYQ